jgi:hypothetical protein
MWPDSFVSRIVHNILVDVLEWRCCGWDETSIAGWGQGVSRCESLVW